MSYQYTTYNENGEMVRGPVPVETATLLGDLLQTHRAAGLKRLLASLRLGSLTLSVGKVKPGELILFYRQLALLLESGIDIVSALTLQRGQAASRILNKTLGQVIRDLQGGSQLSAALARHPKIFSPLHCQSLRVGEHSGNLEVMLRQLADYVEKSAITSKGLKNALMYPIITAVVAVVVVAVLITVVLPAFNNLYTSLGAELPMITRLMLEFSAKLQSYGLYLLLSILIAGGLVYAYIRTEAGKLRWHKFLLEAPVLGRITHLNELARCCRSISLLFKAGLPLTETLPLVVQGTANTAIIEALAAVNRDMLRGEGLSRPMAKNVLFLPMMVQMVRVGEETGNLDTTLLAVAQNYETEAEDRTKSLIGLIQPALTITIGLVVGLVTLSLVSAMYSVYGQVV